MKKLWALLIFLACVGIYVEIAPFNPPVFCTILGGSIVGSLGTLIILLDLRKSQSKEIKL